MPKKIERLSNKTLKEILTASSFEKFLNSLLFLLHVYTEIKQSDASDKKETLSILRKMSYNDVLHVTATSIISYSSYNNKISQILTITRRSHQA